MSSLSRSQRKKKNRQLKKDLIKDVYSIPLFQRMFLFIYSPYGDNLALSTHSDNLQKLYLESYSMKVQFGIHYCHICNVHIGTGKVLYCPECKLIPFCSMNCLTKRQLESKQNMNLIERHDCKMLKDLRSYVVLR